MGRLGQLCLGSRPSRSGGAARRHHQKQLPVARHIGAFADGLERFAEEMVTKNTALANVYDQKCWQCVCTTVPVDVFFLFWHEASDNKI